MQSAGILKVTEGRNYYFRILHKTIHKLRGNRKTMKGNQIIVLTAETDGRIVPMKTETKTADQEVMAELVAYVDGGCLGNPGPSGIGVVISRAAGRGGGKI